MTVELHPDCKARLIDALAAALKLLEVKNGLYLNRTSALSALYSVDKVIPDAGIKKSSVRDQLTNYIEELPIYEFVVDQLSVELLETQQYVQGDVTKKLIEIEGYADTIVVAKRLVDQIASLPWGYTISLELPEKISKYFNKFFSECVLSPNIRLISPDEKFDKQYALLSKISQKDDRIHRPSLLFGLSASPPSWSHTSTYIQITKSGFIGHYGGSNPEVEARRTIKAFFGIGIALGLFVVDRHYSVFPIKSHTFVHIFKSGQWQIDGKLELDDSLSQATNSVACKTYDEKKINEAAHKDVVNMFLNMMRPVFNKAQKADVIFLAAQWLFDSYTGSDAIMNFIQGMVVLEILLGNKAVSDEIGLGTLLGNRCAYLIATNQDERLEILRSFSEIYDVRSQIVHSGKQRLNAMEYTLFNKLLGYCTSVICKEISLL